MQSVRVGTPGNSDRADADRQLASTRRNFRGSRGFRLPDGVRRVVLSPVALAVYVGIALLSAVLMVEDFGDAIQSERALTHHRRCGESPAPCLVTTVGSLTPSFSSRPSALREWSLSVDGEEVDSFDVGESTSDRMVGLDLERVAALRYEGDVVAVITPSGEQIRTLDVGLRGATFAACSILAALGLAVGLVRLAHKMRRITGSWWVQPPDGTVDFADKAAAVPLLGGVADWLR